MSGIYVLKENIKKIFLHNRNLKLWNFTFSYRFKPKPLLNNLILNSFINQVEYILEIYWRQIDGSAAH